MVKKGAAQRNLVVELTPEQHKELISKRCYLCGDLPKYFHGIDRVDNDVGYIFENCRTCCKMCNFMKSNHTLEDFLRQCNKIVDNQGLKLSTEGKEWEKKEEKLEEESEEEYFPIQLFPWPEDETEE